MVNNWRLDQFAKRLYGYTLPPQTVVVEQKSEVNLLSGTGNHCDFVAKQTVETTLSRPEIEDFYRDANVSPVMKSHGERVSIFVHFNDEDQQSIPMRFEISVVDFGYEDFWSYWDIRCG